jgi:uncharacterized membrane protein
VQKTTKLLGGWGYIVAIVFGFLGGFFPPFGGIVTLVGGILVFVAFMLAAGELNRPDIRTNAIIALVLAIAAIIVFVVFIGASVVALLLHHGSEGAMAGFTVGMIAGGIITWILWILCSWFWYRASASLGDGSGQSLFKTGGLLMFIGSITIVVFGLGALVSLIGEIMQTIAFFSVPDKQAQTAAPGAPPPPSQA